MLKKQSQEITISNAPSLVVIRPSFARELLAGDLSYLGTDKALIDAYGRSMLAGDWQINGVTIVLDDEKVVLDGRKRLIASVLHDAPFPTYAVSGVARELVVSIDDYRKRKGVDAFDVSGQEGMKSISQALVTLADMVVNARYRSSRLNTNDAYRFAQTYPDVVDSMKSKPKHSFSKLLGHELTIAFYALTQMLDEEASTRFFDSIEEAFVLGSKRSKGAKLEPADVLIIALHNLSAEKYRHEASAKRRIRRAYVIKAWNAFMSNTPIKQLQWHPDSEEWPAIEGVSRDPFAEFFEPAAAPDHGDMEAFYRERVAECRINMQLTTVTPEAASEMLKSNGPVFGDVQRNRKKSQAQIEKYARDMLSGAWHSNGQSIKISKEGRVIDGQHRLFACVEGNVPFITLLARDVDQSVFSTLDTGKKRNISSYLRDMGVHQTKEVQGALKLIWRYETIGLDAIGTPTNAELLEVWEAHPQIEKILEEKFGNLKNFVNVPTAIAMRVILNGLDKEKSDKFFEGLIHGDVFGRGHPVYGLRERLASIRDNSRRAFASERYRLLLICRAWDYFVKDATGVNMNLRLNAEFPAEFVKKS